MHLEYSKKYFQTIIAALVSLWIMWACFSLVFIADEKEGKAGLFGDSFGGLNALISILGFGAIVYTIQKNRKTEEDQQLKYLEHLQLQNEILEAQKAAAISQEKQAILGVVIANFEAHSSILSVALRDKDLNQEFLRKYGNRLHSMERYSRKLSLDQWLSENMAIEKETFLFDSVHIDNTINLSENVATAAGKILKSWERRSISIKEEALTAQEYTKHYLGKLINLGDSEIKDRISVMIKSER